MKRPKDIRKAWKAFDEEAQRPPALRELRGFCNRWVNREDILAALVDLPEVRALYERWEALYLAWRKGEA